MTPSQALSLRTDLFIQRYVSRQLESFSFDMARAEGLERA
jgi:hypothetical protein